MYDGLFDGLVVMLCLVAVIVMALVFLAGMAFATWVV